jgi:PKD repeat protein
MALLPLSGPSYDLASRPASVQRTVNLMPVPIEPGNERVSWVLKDVPGLVEFEVCVPPAFSTLVVEPTSGDIPLEVQFTLTGAVGNTPFTFLWDFGDGETSTEQNPAHTYEEAGNFDVSVTITNACGEQVIEEEVVAEEPEEPSVSTWNTVSQPLTAQNGVVYAFSNGDKTISVTSGSLGQRVETVSTPVQTTGRRYFELSFNGALDQFGFATGDIFDAGGTLDALTDPVGVLVQVAKDQGGPGYFWWFRSYGIMGGFRSSEYEAPYEVGEPFAARDIPDLANDDRIGFDVDLDAGEVVAIYLNGTEIIPAGISGDDLTAWNAFNSWPANQNAGAMCYHRANEGDQVMNLHMAAADITGPVPSGSTAWDSA